MKIITSLRAKHRLYLLFPLSYLCLTLKTLTSYLLAQFGIRFKNDQKAEVAIILGAIPYNSSLRNSRTKKYQTQIHHSHLNRVYL